MLRLDQQVVPAVASRDGGLGRFVRVEGLWRLGQQIAASIAFVAGVVGEEVLDQARRRLPCSGTR